MILLTSLLIIFYRNERAVTGGAAGEVESAFAVQNACTVLWSNEKSWVRPRSIKYILEIVAVKD
jgi:hypothetical protein